MKNAQKENMMKAIETMRHELSQLEGSVAHDTALEIAHVIIVKDKKWSDGISKFMDEVFEKYERRNKRSSNKKPSRDKMYGRPCSFQRHAGDKSHKKEAIYKAEERQW
eukprot:1081144-Amphidinium_carterae.1